MAFSTPRTRFILEPEAGNLLVVEDSATPIFDEGGILAGAVAVCHDITSRQRIEDEREHLLRELKRSNQEPSRFSYSVAHDLQSPARTVGTLSEALLRKSGSLEPEDLRVLSMIASASQQMQKMITSLLGFAQGAQGELTRVPVYLDRIIENLKVSLHTQISETGASINCDDLPAVIADGALLERVFQNLIANAIHYSRQDVEPNIRIFGKVTEGGWLIAVSDNGSGIPSNALERIFEPLQRLHGHELPGSGLGLALCRSILARHGGRIWAESDGPGTGSTFWIFLPNGTL